MVYPQEAQRLMHTLHALMHIVPSPTISVHNLHSYMNNCIPRMTR
jgi:hypothetical protein